MLEQYKVPFVAAVETSVHESLREVERSLREQMVALADAAKPAIDRVAAAEQALDGAAGRIAGMERALEADHSHVAALETTVTDSFRSIEQSIKDLAVAVEATRIATAQTDGLLERVVEASPRFRGANSSTRNVAVWRRAPGEPSAPTPRCRGCLAQETSAFHGESCWRGRERR